MQANPESLRSAETLEHEMRIQMNELTTKFETEIANLTAQIERLNGENTHLVEQLSHSESSAKDFEEMAVTLDYKLKDLVATHSEEILSLRQELKQAQSDLGQLKGVEQQTKLQTTDLSEELELTKTKLKELASKLRQSESLLGFNQEDRKRIEGRLKDVEKDLKESREKLALRDKEFGEQQSKYHDLMVSNARENERLLKEHHLAIEKVHLELDVMKKAGAKMKEELDSRQRSDSLLMSTPIREAAEESTPVKPTGKSQEQDSPQPNQSEDMEPKKVAESTIDEADNQDEQGDKFFEDAIANGFMTQSNIHNSNPLKDSILRRDTFDNRSINQSRRNSGLSMTRFAFRGRNPDDKLQAELNELKIRLKETNDSHTKKTQELLTELEQKSEQLSKLNKELQETKKVAEQAQTSEMDIKHREDELHTKIKNMQAELTHLNKENDYCRDAAASSSLKVAQICEDYEKNQVALMKKNKAALVELKRTRDCVEQITNTIAKEKIKCGPLETILKCYREGVAGV